MTMNRLNSDTQLDDKRVTKTNVHYAYGVLCDVNSMPGLCFWNNPVILENGTVEICKASKSRWLLKPPPNFLYIYSHGCFHTTSSLWHMSSPVCV